VNDEQLFKLLLTVLERIDDLPITWCLAGSANLRVQGMDVPVNDLDITTTKSGVNLFEELFAHNVVKKHYSEEKQGIFLDLHINNIEVEIINYDDKKDLSMLDKIQITTWKGLKLPTLRLQHAKRFYQMIGRDQKVALIEQYLKNTAK